MKSTTAKSSFLTTTGKYLIMIIVVIGLSGTVLNAQDDAKFAFGPGLSVNIGYFNPKGPNAYITDALSNYMILFGVTDMFIYYEVSGFLNFKTKWVEVTPTFAYAISPKIVTGADEFYFTRMSPGCIANFFIPVGFKGRNAVLIGGGVQYHMMKFQEFEGNHLGYRAQAGFDFQFGNFNLQPVLAVIIANIPNGMSVNETIYDMNYSGIQIGVNMSFHKPVSHR
jgi:hypothetical protein